VKIARISALAALALAAAAVLASPVAAANIVHTRGGLEFHPNRALSQTQRFVPGTIYVKPGGIVRWVDGDKTVEPHTIMAVRKAELPRTLDQIFACPVCAHWKEHLVDPTDENSGIGRTKVRVGPDGFQTPGDSIFLFDRGRDGAYIRAAAGKTIHYMCAFHPWMQGTIKVTRTGKPPARR
jgi:plastocyanin